MRPNIIPYYSCSEVYTVCELKKHLSRVTCHCICASVSTVTTHQLREDLFKVLDVDLVAVLGFSLFLGPHGRFWRHETWNISSLSSSPVKLQTFLTSDKYSEHLCHEGCSVPADCNTEEGWRISRPKVLYCEMFGQLTSRFILLEKARQEFADGVLWHK